MKRARQAGNARELFALGRPVVTKDANGAEVVGSWEERRVWGWREPLSGREFMQAAVLKDAVDCRITTAWDPTFVPTAQWRFVDVDSGAVFSIVTVMIDAANRLVECMCRVTLAQRDGR
jgi:head-tail adaptor